MATKRRADPTKSQKAEMLRRVSALSPSYQARESAIKKQNAKYDKDTKGVRESIKAKDKSYKETTKALEKKGMIDAGFVNADGKKKSKPQLEREAAAKKDPRLGKLDEKAQTNLNTVRNANKESKDLGGENKEKKSTFVKVLDFILRPARATARAATDNQDEYYQSRYEGDGKIKALAKGFVAGADGFLGDIAEGKVRDTGKSFLENTRGNLVAKKKGVDPSTIGRVKASSKGGKVADAVVGFGFDVFSDPTTYVGLGLVGRAVGTGGKVLKSDEVAKMLEATVKTTQQLNQGRNKAEDSLAVARLLAAERTPVKALKKKDFNNLSDEAKAVYEYAKSMQKGRRGVRVGGSESAHLGKKSTLSTSKNQSIKVAVQTEARETVNAFKIAEQAKAIQKFASMGRDISDPLVKKAAAAKANKEALKQGVDADSIAENMLAVMNRNLSPTIKKNVRIGVGPAGVVLPTLGIAKSARAVGSIPHVAKTVEGFHKALNANYKIVSGATRIRNQVAGVGTSQIKAHVEELKSVFDPLKKADRQAMMKAWRTGAKSGSYRGGVSLLRDGAPVDDAIKYFDENVQNLQNSFDTFYKDMGLDHHELNRFLGDKFKIGEMEFYDKGFVREDWFRNMLLRSDKVKDPAEALLLFQGALTSALTKRALWDQFRENFGVISKVPVQIPGTNQMGVAAEAAAAKTAKTLQQSYGYVKAIGSNGKPIKGLEDAVFHPEIAESMKRLDDMFKDPKTTGQIINQYDKALQTWKGLVTRYNPSFHTRTLLGEVLLGYLGGMRNIPGSYAKAAKVLRNRNQEFLNPRGSVSAAGSGLSGRQINARNVLARGGANSRLASTTGSSAVVARHPKFGDITADQFWHLYQESGLKSGFASADLVRNVDPLKSTKLGQIDTSVSNLTEGVEDFGRMAHFIDAITYSKAGNLQDAVEEAAEIVAKMHLDYTAVTGFEKSAMTRLMPFYKWIRLSSPLMIEHLLHSPGKALVVPKTMQMVSNATGYDVEEFGAFPGGPDAVVPEFLRSHGAMPIGNFFGNTNYYDPTALFPLAGTVEATSPSKILGMMTPAIKAPAELGLDQTFFGGQPSKDYKQYALSQLPQTNFANNMVTGGNDPDIPRKQRLIQMLANPGIQPNTQKRQSGETYRQRDEALAHRKALKKKLGIEP